MENTEHLFYITEIDKLIILSLPPSILEIEGSKSFVYIGNLE